jgi:curved DNA-binding protein CbpA
MTMNEASTISNPKHDLYEVLQVSPRANADVIRAAYHVLARGYHPDVNPGPSAVRQMRQINVAYSVLSDPIQRAEYDARGAEAARASRLRRAAGSEARAPQAEARSRRGRPRGPTEARVEPEARRALLSPLGRMVVAGLIMSVAVALCFGVWAVFEALDGGISRVTPVRDAEPAFFTPFSRESGPIGIGGRR